MKFLLDQGLPRSAVVHLQNADVIVDLVEIIHLHPDRVEELTLHVAQVHHSYRERFQAYVRQSNEEH